MLSSLALKRSLYVVTQCDFRFACHNEQGLCLGLPARLQDENPGLLQLRLAMRQADLVQAVYRRVVWDEAWENLATMKWPSLTFNSRLNQITLEITSKQAMQTTLVEIHSMMVVRTSSNPLFLTFFLLCEAGFEDDAPGTVGQRHFSASFPEGRCRPGQAIQNFQSCLGAVWLFQDCQIAWESPPSLSIFRNLPQTCVAAGRPVWRSNIFDTGQLADERAYGWIARYGRGLGDLIGFDQFQDSTMP